MTSKVSKDFREWDIAPETSVAGIDANGFPFYVWRESADNRLTLGRPRYCCITPHDGQLYFSFFNPSDDTKASGGWVVFFAVGAIVVLAKLGTAWLNPAPPLPYHLDESLPPFLILLGALFAGGKCGAIAGGVVHIFVTISRWIFGRFPGQGRLNSMPYGALSGFNQVHAGEIGAKIGGKEAKSGHGVTAVFDDGSMFILTGNAWDYPSIVGKHREFTQAFRTRRDEILADWVARQKKTTRAAEHRPIETSSPSPTQSIPDSL